tara:strand:+ start:66153 stop:66440 length:288 start_codon:yes stop_codon:yes gene_type:complete
MNLGQVQDFSNEDCFEDSKGKEIEGIVSFHAQVPAPLQASMKKFIETYPKWDQYRLVKAALAGFLVQHGVESRSITRLYVANMFSLNTSFERPSK